MKRVFISHSTIDDNFVNQLVRDLKSSEIDTFVDHEDILLGSPSWEDEVWEAMKECDAMVAVISPESIKSKNCRDEWNYYINKEKEIIPVWLRGDEMFFRLDRLQYVRMQTANEYTIGLSKLKDFLTDNSINVPQINKINSTTKGIIQDDIRSELYSRYPIKRLSEKSIGLASGNIVEVLGSQVIVNSENQRLEMAQSHQPTVSAAIRNHAIVRDENGKIIWQIKRRIEEIHERDFDSRDVPPGIVIVTPSGNLQNNGVRHILHAISVIGHEQAGIKPVTDVELRLCVANALRKVDALNADMGKKNIESLTRIVFPIFATGKDGGQPLEKIAPMLIERAIEYLIAEETAIETVYFIGYRAKQFRQLQEILNNIPDLGEEEKISSVDHEDNA